MSGLAIRTEQDLKVVLAKEYMKQIENFFGDHDRAMEFLSNVVAATQRNPKLLECTPQTLLNSFMVMASLKLMPSGVSGEAYVIPYKGDAQFQLGYQGLVTLFYRAGCRSIIAEIVREKDTFSFLNGELHHVANVFSDDRGAAIGAYVIVELQTGAKITKAMSKKDILAIGSKFSQSFKSDFTPWNEKNDPELWMWKKTVLKQAAKLVPKNETIYRALAEDNKDSIIPERKEESDWKAAGPSAYEIAGYRDLVKNCTTIADLERVSADLPADVRIALKADIGEVKVLIASAAADELVID